jgi:hypothetical protein
VSSLNIQKLWRTKLAARLSTYLVSWLNDYIQILHYKYSSFLILWFCTWKSTGRTVRGYLPSINISIYLCRTFQNEDSSNTTVFQCYVGAMYPISRQLHPNAHSRLLPCVNLGAGLLELIAKTLPTSECPEYHASAYHQSLLDA